MFGKHFLDIWLTLALCNKSFPICMVKVMLLILVLVFSGMVQAQNHDFLLWGMLKYRLALIL